MLFICPKLYGLRGGDMTLRNCALAAWLGALVFSAGLLACDAEPDAAVLVESSTELVLDRLRADKQRYLDDPASFQALVNELVLPHFDVEQMGRMILGSYGAGAETEQVQAFVDQFTLLLIRTYSSALKSFQDQQVDYAPVNAPPEATRVVVRTRVVGGSGTPIPVDYRLALSDCGWKVQDVRIDGISLVVSYRSEYGAILEREGLGGLIGRLQTRNEALAL
ncbi:MAG: ABC transporter substrate-binding protein, partial [Gammaproteobacteria bacterium]|nr:ABC transporter substrate-binding protein [Gammaproteobacteria bacterium]